jgi:hypothetical protein
MKSHLDEASIVGFQWVFPKNFQRKPLMMEESLGIQWAFHLNASWRHEAMDLEVALPSYIWGPTLLTHTQNTDIEPRINLIDGDMAQFMS